MVENNISAVSSFASSLNDGVEDIGVIIEHKTDVIRKDDGERRVAELKEQEERRKAE